MPDPMTVNEAAVELGLKPATVRTQIRNGLIKPSRRSGRVWLISRSQVVRYREQHLGRPGRRPGQSPKSTRGSSSFSASLRATDQGVE